MSIELLGIYSLLSQLISGGQILNGIINNYLIIYKYVKVKYLSLVLLIAGILTLIILTNSFEIKESSIEGFEFIILNKQFLFLIGITVLMTLINFTEYKQIKNNKPFMVFEQNFVFFTLLLLIILIYKPQNSFEILVSICGLSFVKYVIFIISENEFINYQRILKFK